MISMIITFVMIVNDITKKDPQEISKLAGLKHVIEERNAKKASTHSKAKQNMKIAIDSIPRSLYYYSLSACESQEYYEKISIIISISSF